MEEAALTVESILTEMVMVCQFAALTHQKNAGGIQSQTPALTIVQRMKKSESKRKARQENGRVTILNGE